MSHDPINRSAQSWKKSEKHGAGEWLAERFTSIALIPLTLWAAYAAFTIAGTGYDGALAFVAKPFNILAIAATMLITAWHMYMGVKVIIDDYIGKPGTRGFLLFLTFVLSAAVVVATGVALWLVYQGA
ncbi:succinate dehydrogenase, hydrophobic membrane anchor protein [Asticcacaulis biprosthecium C19]|uniref:Succinate dehydrogenase hydrophobic membrane anchor subunit n=1 Tax=Asticcacaulis biprosthecium C19 TaxID=715226 RepID=F4QL00_9CAUL|nr:succinate dehydrogenase, hydrophobic membrane anchor protein [Asticcacaulis biprosthecium]EGF92223.1 succinate dehydrogenase, hydrophobic membrane anchor protein [Asticcacaulis biprosthecium C19]